MNTLTETPTIQLAENWMNRAADSTAAGVRPRSLDIAQMSALVDSLHDKEQHQTAHQLDDAMCDWCELINQRGI